ncbi:hypothetical protein MCI89_01005 [Muricomes sp. OA1]|uniref:HPr family phosphocarrier protein n=1 Tax=Hungatella hathewayi TaxID=154046 RepID=A0A3E2WEQ0_9FIRM|nr:MULTISPECIES: hypothetical protein [Clostridia]MCH1970926.1 hypothetical protein [Muricomes sp. OA1]RGC24056.1 hypothetical protein DWX41_21815 [Hungatella hathewayi]GKH34271.1 hypothetical protein CE91St64_36780 [Faecalicatena contorta]
MKTYVIHLDTVQNLKDYLYMLGSFSFTGIVATDCANVQPEDILSLFDRCSDGTFVLMVQGCEEQVLESMEKYLEDCGLVCHNKKTA